MRVLRDVLLTLIALIVIVAIAGYLFARGGGLSAQRQPGTLESAIAVRLRAGRRCHEPARRTT